MRESKWESVWEIRGQNETKQRWARVAGFGLSRGSFTKAEKVLECGKWENESEAREAYDKINVRNRAPAAQRYLKRLRTGVVFSQLDSAGKTALRNDDTIFEYYVDAEVVYALHDDVMQFWVEGVH